MLEPGKILFSSPLLFNFQRASRSLQESGQLPTSLITLAHCWARVNWLLVWTSARQEKDPTLASHKLGHPPRCVTLCGNCRRKRSQKPHAHKPSVGHPQNQRLRPGPHVAPKIRTLEPGPPAVVIVHGWSAGRLDPSRNTLVLLARFGQGFPEEAHMRLTRASPDQNARMRHPEF